MRKRLYSIGILIFAAIVSGEIIPSLIVNEVELHHTKIILPLREIPDHKSRVNFIRKEMQKDRSIFFNSDDSSWADNVYRRFRNDTLSFQWECTAGEKGPFNIEISKTEDFSNPLVYIVYKNWSNGVWDSQYRLEAYYNSLEIGTKYYWRVKKYNLNSKENPVVYSPISSFTTQDLPPRHICLEHNYSCEGRATNFRDMGGWTTLDGKKVKQGLLFRSNAFNDTSTDMVHEGRIRIGMADRQFLLETLKLKGELDLRSTSETANATQSVLGPDIAYYQLQMPAYSGAFSDGGKAQVGAAFHILADPKNLPLVFHCVGGADRTATLAIFINGLLGVSQHDLECDWEITFLPDLPCLTRNCKSRCCSLVFHGLEKYGTQEDTLAHKIELYLLECGVTPEEMNRLKKMLLE